MDGQKDVSRQAKQDCLAAGSLGKQTTEAIEAVANRLAIIGDDLNQSYEKHYDSGVNVTKAKSCLLTDILSLLLKASS